MEDFTNRHRKRRRAASIDGFSTPTRRSPTGGSIDLRRPKTYQPNRNIDDFGAQEGFRPANTNVINAGLGNDFARPDKKGLFGRKDRRRPRLDGDDRVRKISMRKKLFKLSAVFAVLLVISSGSFLFAKGYINLRKVFKGNGGAAALQQNVDPSLLRGEGDGRINILVSGRAGAGQTAPDLTDTIILVSIDPLTKEAGLVSIPRDFYVTVEDVGSMKINSVFYTGKMNYLAGAPANGNGTVKKAEEEGLKLLDETVSDLLGIPVHYHAIVDFAGFEAAVDRVGGIDINAPEMVQEHMLIYGKPYYLNVKKGQQHIGGFEALAYSRSRFTSARGDFDRSGRQRLVMLALKEKIVSAGTYSNPIKVAGLMDDLGNHVKTNFSVDEIKSLYEISKDITPGKVFSVGLADPPNNFITTGNGGGLSVVMPSAGISDYSEIHAFIRNVLRDSFIRKENPAIVVLNGTDRAGAAEEKARELKSYGYNVVRADNAPNRNFHENVLVDLRSGKKKYTKRYLELRMDTLAVEHLPSGMGVSDNVDYVIIIGE